MRFFHKVILLITAIFCCKPSFAQQFEPKEFAGVKYQEFAKLSSDDKMPALLIYLHGKSGCGTDNERQIQVPSVWDIEKYLRESKMSIYFIAPQCPPTHEWAAHRDMPGYKDKIFELIEHYIKDVGVDTNRIYLCGFSMGAMGTWKILRERSDFFAAAFIFTDGFTATGTNSSRCRNLPLASRTFNEFRHDLDLLITVKFILFPL